MTLNTQTAATHNVLVSTEQERLNAKRAASRTKVASGKAQSAAQPHVPPTPPTATGDAMLAAIYAELVALKAENAALKSGKPAPKADKQPRPPVNAQNVTWAHDAEAGTVTLVLDLNAIVLDDDGNRKLSSTGKTYTVGGANGKLANKKGVEIGFSLNVFEKVPGTK